jgi:hypothetical protein
MEQLGEEEQQQQQEEVDVVFNAQLASVLVTRRDFFYFRETIVEDPARWNVAQALLAVSKALTDSKGVAFLSMDLAVCRSETVRLFLDYIGSSTSLRSL